ncbi:TPA: glutathione S-transferase family protein, partial [Klebsiella pneumoniae]|nr:glutathione S-transferase family protein [Klebsiella pneumoniae]
MSHDRATLYGLPGWGSTLAEIMLVAASTPFDFVAVEGFDAPGPNRNRILALNPLGQIPVLVLADGQVMTESAAIALHLAETHPGAGLAPAPGDPARARFLRLLVWIVANIYPTFTYGDYPERWAPRDAEALVAHTDAYRIRLWEWLEGEVTGPWVLGTMRSALDLFVAVMVHWRPRPGERMDSEEPPNVRVACSGDIDEVVRLMHDAAAWMSAKGTPAWDVARIDRTFAETFVLRSELLVASCSDGIVGCCTLSAEDPEFWPDAL